MDIYVPAAKRSFYHAVSDLYEGTGVPQGYDYELPAPVSTNRLWACVNGRTIKTRYARAYQKRLADKYYEQGWYRQAGMGAAAFAALLVYYPSRQGREMDLDNITKIVFDTFQQFGIIEDDKTLRYLVCIKAQTIERSELFVSLRALEPIHHTIKRYRA